MIDIRYSAVAEFRGGQVPGSSKLGQRLKGVSWEIITPAIVLHSNGESTTLLPQFFQSIFGPIHGAGCTARFRVSDTRRGT